MKTLRINQIAFGLQAGVLGARLNRMGVWTQGCSLPKCPGCTSVHTWSPTGGKVLSIETVLQLARARRPAPTGLTISGGEPTDQAETVAELIRGFRALFVDAEIVLYTALRWPVLERRHSALVSLLDVAVTGPFVERLKATPLAGSGNQEVRLLTPMADELYRGWQDWPMHRLQVGSTKADQVITVGIPDTARMAKAAEGVSAVGVSWNRNLQEHGK